MKYDIFISYSRNDVAIVKEVVAKLESAGFAIWMDVDGIYSGDAFKSVIVNAIENSENVVFFSSKSSNISPWTTKEIAVSIYKKKRIIPIRLDNSNYSSEIMFDLINVDYIDLSNLAYINECVERLIKTICKQPNNEIVNPNDVIIGEKHAEKNKFKLLLSFKGCLVSITLVLVVLLTTPFILRLFTSNLPETHISPIFECAPNADPSECMSSPDDDCAPNYDKINPGSRPSAMPDKKPKPHMCGNPVNKTNMEAEARNELDTGNYQHYKPHPNAADTKGKPLTDSLMNIY